MLVLSRKIGERIVINDSITVVVQRLNGNRVSLGIEAPPEVSVLRGELCNHDSESDRASEHRPVLAKIGFEPAAPSHDPWLRRIAK